MKPHTRKIKHRVPISVFRRLAQVPSWSIRCLNYHRIKSMGNVWNVAILGKVPKEYGNNWTAMEAEK